MGCRSRTPARRDHRAAPARRVGLLAILAVALFAVSGACRDGGRERASAAGATRTIAQENSLPGDSDWAIEKPAIHGEVAGYAGQVSAERGDELKVFISTRVDGAPVRARVYRMGWYGGAGARLIATTGEVDVPAQGWWTPEDGLHDCPTCQRDPETRLLESRWRPTLSLRVRRDWVSGVYLVRLDEMASGTSAFVPFVVRDDESRAPIIVQASTNTWQAYNAWGDASLYGSFQDDRSYVGKTARAYRVSYDRPYDPAINSSRNDGAGQFFSWEYNFVRWAEARGYEMTYTTNVDVSQHPESLRRHGLFVSVGHDEYWTREERDAADAARDSGVNEAFFGGNAAYWQSRLEPSTQGDSARILTVYKDASLDPLASEHPERVTALFSEPPVSRPQSLLTGVAYGSNATPDYQDWRPVETSHWAFASSGIEPGQSFPGILGYEYDRLPLEDARPAGLTVLASSPVRGFLGADQAASTIYTSASGANVFAAGTIAWAWGLDDYGHGEIGKFADPRLQRLTANIIERLSAASPAAPGG